MNLTLNETDLINKLRGIPFGEVLIVMHNGQPDRIERAIAKEKLGQPEKETRKIAK